MILCINGLFLGLPCGEVLKASHSWKRPHSLHSNYSAPSSCISFLQSTCHCQARVLHRCRKPQTVRVNVFVTILPGSQILSVLMVTQYCTAGSSTPVVSSLPLGSHNLPYCSFTECFLRKFEFKIVNLWLLFAGHLSQ